MRMIHSVVIREKPPSKRPRKQSNSFHAPELVRDRLLDHIGWNAKYNKIKTSFSPDIIEILKGPYAQHQTPEGFTINTELNLFS